MLHRFVNRSLDQAPHTCRILCYLVPRYPQQSVTLFCQITVATLIAFTPIFIANVVFAQRFKDTSSSTTAFGANLLGAMVGGVLEYASLAVGYRALVIGAAALYALAYLTGRRYLEGPTPAEPTTAGDPAPAVTVRS